MEGVNTMSRTVCQCESSKCDHEDGCNRTPSQTVHTVYGKFEMCGTCAYRMPAEYLKKTVEFVDWAERFPEESAVQIAVRQSTFCLCGKPKDIGQSSCGCKAGI